MQLKEQQLRMETLEPQKGTEVKIPEVVNLPCSSAWWTGSACLRTRVINSADYIPSFMARHQDQVLEVLKEILQSNPIRGKSHTLTQTQNK